MKDDILDLLTLKRPGQEELEKEWGRGKCETRGEKYTEAKEVKSSQMWVVLDPRIQKNQVKKGLE